VSTPDELRHAVETYVATINARDPEAIAALFTEDAVQADPASAPPNVGRRAIAAFFADGIAASESWEFAADAVHTCASTVAIDFSIAVHLAGARCTSPGSRSSSPPTTGGSPRPTPTGTTQTSRSPERAVPTTTEERPVTDASGQIQNLVHRYAELIDLGDFDGLGHLLARAEVRRRRQSRLPHRPRRGGSHVHLDDPPVPRRAPPARST